MIQLMFHVSYVLSFLFLPFVLFLLVPFFLSRGVLFLFVLFLSGVLVLVLYLVDALLLFAHALFLFHVPSLVPFLSFLYPFVLFHAVPVLAFGDVPFPLILIWTIFYFCDDLQILILIVIVCEIYEISFTNLKLSLADLFQINSFYCCTERKINTFLIFCDARHQSQMNHALFDIGASFE